MLKRFAYVSTNLFLTVVPVLHLACAPGDGPSRPVAEASGAETETSQASSDVPVVDALASLEKVYVPLHPESLQSLDDALEQNGYGNVKSSDFVPRFETVETKNGAAIAAYSTSEWIGSSSLFQPMSLTQWLESALADERAQGVVINPGHPGQTLSLTKAEIAEALEWLPRRDPLPTEIYVTQ